MRDHTVTLHLTEAQTAIPSTSLCRLPCQDLRRTTTSRVHLVLDHVLQSLVICRPEEDHDFHLLASEAIVHYLVASKLVAERVQLCRDPIDCVTTFFV